jgi:F0F1-type ATP synthase epsilon subunit
MSDIFYNQQFDLLIRDRSNVLFEGKASAVSMKNETGVLDILPYHTNFISIVKEFVLFIDQAGKENKIPIDTGIVKVYQNEVKVYLGIFSTTKSK